ncbi:hypothetical protein BAE44_0007874, partial [Dichanthelium oligosanthes]
LMQMQISSLCHDVALPNNNFDRKICN